MGANDSRAALVVDGDLTPLQRKLREAGANLKQFGNEGQAAFERMGGPIERLQSKFVAIAGILAGGAVFKAAVEETRKYTEESINLGRALGTNATVASTYIHALEDIGVPVETFAASAQMLAKRLREDEDEITALGLKTRDAAGNLRPLNEMTTDAIALLQRYNAGTDRALAGNVMFGRSFDNNSRLIELNVAALEESRAMQERLGLVVGGENVEAFKAYRSSMDGVDFTLKAVKTTIGNALMPVLTVLGNWFAAVGPAAILAIRGALGGLLSLFWGLKTAASVAFNVINAAVVQVAEPIRAVGVAFWKLVHGDFEGAKAEIANIPKVWSQAWDQSFDNIVEAATEARDQMYRLFAESTPLAGKDPEGRRYQGKPDKDKKGKSAGEESHMATYEAALAERKNLYEQENSLRQYSKEQELAYWRDLQAAYVLTTKDQLAIAKRTAQLELEIRRDLARDGRALALAGIDHKRADALAQVQYDETIARFQEENGEITKRHLIAQEEEFARRRFEIEYQAVLDRLELAKRDPSASPEALLALKEQMLEIERNYQLRRLELGQEKHKAENSFGAMFEDAGAAFGNMASTMLTRATTLQQALAGVFQSIYQSFVQNVVAKPLAEWIGTQAKMLAVKLGFATQEQAIQAASSATTVATKSAEATAVVAANAAEAGAGAAASQASIPFVGPAMALAAMAAVFAAVMALGGRKSAARGYDIPRGVNPVTQLHEEEMVLPAKFANVIRGLAAGEGGNASPAPGLSLTIKAFDARDVRRLFLDHREKLTDAIKTAYRDGVR